MTQEEIKISYITTVANQASRREKVSWQRKERNMQLLIDEINKLQEQINEIEEMKTPTLKQIASLREQMVLECIHPQDQIAFIPATHATPQHAICKFCNKTLALVVQNGKI